MAVVHHADVKFQAGIFKNWIMLCDNFQLVIFQCCCNKIRSPALGAAVLRRLWLLQLPQGTSPGAHQYSKMEPGPEMFHFSSDKSGISCVL